MADPVGAKLTAIMQTTAPLTSHFSCWRRSPPACRQLCTCRATNASQNGTYSAITTAWTAASQPAG